MKFHFIHKIKDIYITIKYISKCKNSKIYRNSPDLQDFYIKNSIKKYYAKKILLAQLHYLFRKTITVHFNRFGEYPSKNSRNKLLFTDVLSNCKLVITGSSLLFSDVYSLEAL